MVTKTTRMSTARPRTTIAGRMEIPPGAAGRWGAAEGALAGELGAGVVQRHAHGQPTAAPTTRNGRGGRAPTPRRQPAPPASARATNAFASAMASATADAARQVRRDGSRERAARAVVVARDHPPPGQDLDAVGAGHDVFGRVAQVAALHHDVAGAACPQLLGDAAPRRDVGERLDIGPGEDGRLAQVRRDDERVGHQQLEVGLDPLAARSARCPVEETRTGSTTSWARRPSAARAATSATIGAVASMPVLTLRTAKSSSTVSTCWRTKAGSSATTPRTSAVFCAVTAVSAHVPCTRSAANVLRSACAPAPPPESDPAIVSAVGGVSSGTEQP